jgi:DNA-binding winged helix-turn-helix (wHTH) protein/tetratricopeptide (TPR) repeat protein
MIPNLGPRCGEMIYTFGDFELDEERWELRQRGGAVEVPPKVMQTLSFLLKNRERVVSKDELVAELWPNVSVTEASLMKAIRLARLVLGDDGDAQNVIKTVRGRGYRFVAEAELVERAASPPRPSAPPLGRSEPPLLAEPFLDREAQLQELELGLMRASAGRTAGFLVSGDAGIGKTRLAEVFAATAEARGARVAWGRCCEEGGAPELRPWIQILQRLREIEGVTPDDLAKLEPVARLFPEHERSGDTASWPIFRTEPERFRAFDAIGDFFRSIARHKPLLLILEDLHTADAASLILTHFVVREVADASIVLVGTYRPGELDREPSTPRLFGKLMRETREIALGGLSEASTRRMIQAGLTGPAADPRVVGHVHKVTEGNPLFVAEVVRLLAAEPLLAGAQGLEELRVPERIVEALRGRFDRLPPATRDVLSIAAVVGRQFELPLLRELSGLGEGELAGLLDPAIERKIIAPFPRKLGAYHFTHILFRDVLYEGLPLSQRAELHRRVGELLESLPQSAEAPAAQLAHHFLRASLGAGSPKAADYSILAGKQALDSFAFEEAALHFGRALEALRFERGTEALTCETLLSLGHAQRLSGDYSAAGTSFERGLAVARKLDDSIALAKAALGYAQVRPEIGVANQEVLPKLEEAVRALRETNPDEANPALHRELLSLLLARLGLCLSFTERTEESQALSREAVDLARAHERPLTLANALLSRHWVLWHPAAADERRAISAELIELERQCGDELALPEARLCQIFDLLELGERSALERSVVGYDRLAHKRRDPLAMWNTRVIETMQSIMEGRFAEAEGRARETLQVGLPIHETNARVYYFAHMFWIRCEQGRAAEVETAPNPKRPGERWLLARGERLRLHCEAGDEAAASRYLEKLAQNDFDDLRRDWSWFPAIAHVATASALLGDRARATRIHAILLPFADIHVVLGPAVVYLGPVSYYLGRCALALARHDEAIDWGEKAAEAATQMNARPLLARARLHLAEALSRRGSNGDRALAADAAGHALALSRELGMREIERLALAIDARLREQLPTQPAHPRP